MRQKIVTAFCVLAMGACAHRQQPREETSSHARARDTRTTSASTVTPSADEAQSSSIVSQGMPDPNAPSLGLPQLRDASGGTSDSDQALDTTQPAAGQAAAPGPEEAVDSPPPAGAADSKELARAAAAQDIELRERIQSTLGSASNLSYSARHVGVAVDRSEVTLSGDVRNERERKEVANIVQQIQGVRRVKNQISSISQTNVRGAP